MELLQGRRWPGVVFSPAWKQSRRALAAHRQCWDVWGMQRCIVSWSVGFCTIKGSPGITYCFIKTQVMSSLSTHLHDFITDLGCVLPCHWDYQCGSEWPGWGNEALSLCKQHLPAQQFHSPDSTVGAHVGQSWPCAVSPLQSTSGCSVISSSLRLCAGRTELLHWHEFEEVLTMLHPQQHGHGGGSRRGCALTQHSWLWSSKSQRERPPPPAKPPPDEEEEQHVEKIGHGASCEVCEAWSGVFYRSVV